MDELTIFLLLFVAVIILIFLYCKQFELFLVVILAINHEVFYLFPKKSGMYYSDFLFVIMTVLLAIYFMRQRKLQIWFKKDVILFLFIIFLGILVPYFTSDQSISLGLRAARNYFLLLMYFPFNSKPIEQRKFAFWIVGVGVALAALNNIQYFIQGTQIFYYQSENELIREGKVRFLIGDFFTIFAPFVAFGEYLQRKDIKYLVAAIYMVATVIIQGQTRAVIIGVLLTPLILLWLYNFITFKKSIVLSVLLVVTLFYIGEISDKSTFGSLVRVTHDEVVSGEGNWGIRLLGYEYYFSRISESPIIGKGIWNDLFTGDNPEDMKYKKIFLSDLGLTSMIFHFGIIGVFWLILLFWRVYALGVRKLGFAVHPMLPAYFIFGIVTCVTLNCFTRSNTIVYLALSLALLDQEIRGRNNTESISTGMMDV